MNWDAIGAVGEILGALAVVLTLIYLSTQVKYAKKAASDNNRLERAAGVREMCLAYMSDPELRALSIKTYGSEYLEKIAQELNISVDEAFILDQQNAYWFWLHRGQFASTTNADDEKELDNLIRTFYNSRPIRVCWENSAWHKPLLDKRFIAYVEERFE